MGRIIVSEAIFCTFTFYLYCRKRKMPREDILNKSFFYTRKWTKQQSFGGLRWEYLLCFHLTTMNL